MSLESRIRRLERLIGNHLAQPEPMTQRLIEALPDWQLLVLLEAFDESLGEEVGGEPLGEAGERMTELFLFAADELEGAVASGALAGDLPTREMLRLAAARSFELEDALRELGELLRRRGEPDDPSRPAEDPDDPFRLVV